MGGHQKPVSEKLQAWREKRKEEIARAKINNTQRIISMIPSSCLPQDNINPEISPSDCLQLCKALMEYVRLIPDCYSESDFLLDCTGFKGKYLSERLLDADKWMEKVSEEDKRAIKNACRIYSRARELCERHVIQSHVATNPQFAQFYLKNKFGYIDKSEQNVQQSGSITLNLSIPPPDLPPKKLEDSTK